MQPFGPMFVADILKQTAEGNSFALDCPHHQLSLRKSSNTRDDSFELILLPLHKLIHHPVSISWMAESGRKQANPSILRMGGHSLPEVAFGGRADVDLMGRDFRV